jgi:NADP-dependent 3-hydroxy acid dehydrogenase YdfG
MGIYAITGGTKGIGKKTKALLEEAGHKVININVDCGEICADLGTREGRKYVLDALHAAVPTGLTV